MSEEVVLVDQNDMELGVMEKMEAHRTNSLHRAISILIFNEKGEMMLQQRALGKYHSPGLWTNACCSHPRPGESAMDAANRRLVEEMGLECPLEFAFKFLYQCDMEGGLSEHELDHVFVGQCAESPSLNPQEAMDWKYVSMEQLYRDVAAHPEDYTFWFKVILKEWQITNSQ